MAFDTNGLNVEYKIEFVIHKKNNLDNYHDQAKP
jgi:hypothetical protein